MGMSYPKYIFAEALSMACSMREIAVSPPLVSTLTGNCNITKTSNLFCRRDGSSPLRGCSCAVVRPRRAGLRAVTEPGAACAPRAASVPEHGDAVSRSCRRTARFETDTPNNNFFTPGGCGSLRRDTSFRKHSRENQTAI